MCVYNSVMRAVCVQALLFAERNKTAGLKRLLEAGGARVYTSGTKYVCLSSVQYFI